MGFPPFYRLTAVFTGVLPIIVSSQIAFASSPSDLTPLGPSLPSCVAGAPDTSGAHICWVTPLRPGWQASTGEWIVVRVGNAAEVDPSNPDAARILCAQLQASVVATITLDAEPLPVDTIPCELRPGSPAVWFVDWRALSHPLTPGDHSFTARWYFTQTVDGIGNAGDTAVFPTQTVSVMPQG